MTVFGGENADSYYDEGVTASMKGDLEAAVRHFERAIEMDRNHYAAYHQLGKCHLRLGDARKAAELLQHVLRNKPTQVQPRLDYAFALMELGEWKKAQDIFGEVSREKPNNPRASLGLAYCAFQAGQWDAAMRLAQTAANQGGGNFAALFLLGRAAGRAGRAEIAAEAFKKADAVLETHLETSPNQPEGHYLRGELHAAQRSFDKAIEHYARAAECAQPGRQYSAYDARFNRVDVLCRRAYCLYKIGQREAALKIARDVLAEDPDNAWARQLIQGKQ